MAVSGDGPKAAHLWGAVPDVLHWSVASFVDGRSLCAMAACCRAWTRWEADGALWERLCVRHDQTALRRRARPIQRLELDAHVLEAYGNETLRLVVVGAAPRAGTTSLVHRFLGETRQPPRAASHAAIRIQHACVGPRAGASRLVRIVEETEARRARRMRIIEEGRYFGIPGRGTMYQGAGVLVVADISSPTAAADAARAFDVIFRDTAAAPRPRLILCATKADLHYSDLTHDRLAGLASAVGAFFVRASSRDGTGVETAFLLPFVS